MDPQCPIFRTCFCAMLSRVLQSSVIRIFFSHHDGKTVSMKKHCAALGGILKSQCPRGMYLVIFFLTLSVRASGGGHDLWKSTPVFVTSSTCSRHMCTLFIFLWGMKMYTFCMYIYIDTYTHQYVYYTYTHACMYSTNTDTKNIQKHYTHNTHIHLYAHTMHTHTHDTLKSIP